MQSTPSVAIKAHIKTTKHSLQDSGRNIELDTKAITVKIVNKY